MCLPKPKVLVSRLLDLLTSEHSIKLTSTTPNLSFREESPPVWPAGPYSVRFSQATRETNLGDAILYLSPVLSGSLVVS